MSQRSNCKYHLDGLHKIRGSRRMHEERSLSRRPLYEVMATDVYQPHRDRSKNYDDNLTQLREIGELARSGENS